MFLDLLGQLRDVEFSVDEFNRLLDIQKETAVERLSGLNAAADLLQSSVLPDMFQRCVSLCL